MSSSIRLEKPWRSLDESEVDGLPGQLGVYEIANDREETVLIGYAGGHSQFGLRSELQECLARSEDRARLFRTEVTMQYLTRYQELLMIFLADHGRLPVENTERPSELGRLRLAE